MKNLLIVILSFITIFISNSRVYAFENEAKKQEVFYLQQQEKIVNTDLQPFMIADNNTIIKIVNPSPLWIGSVFFMGLGQILLGDFLRGAKFWLFSILSTIIIAAITRNGSLSASISVLIFQIWSIMDAYEMATDLAVERVRLTDSRKIKEALNILEKFSISDNSLKFQAISF